MNLMSLMATLSLDSSAYKEGLEDSQSTASSAGEKIGKALSGITRAVEVAAAAGAAAVGKLTYDAVKSYANYEQLIGGVETLFQDSADIVSAKTAGISANEYMETVTSFSASLLQSLGGDTQAAAEYADLAITDMSDNANKMGSSMESIQCAYQGFAKQNFTMLDNLKLGYGGTKTEMERLIEDAEKLDTTFQATRDTNGELTMSYADIVDAIHIVQTNMGITGTTAKEAATTIEGSVNSMKASWRNLITGLGNADADIGELVGNFTTSLETAFGNIVPVAERAISSMTEALPRLVGTLLPKLVAAINNLLPSLMNTVTDLINSIANQLPTMVSGIVKALPSLLETIFSNIGSIAGSLLPSLVESLSTVLLNIPSMLVGAVSGIVTGVANLFTGIGKAFDKAISPRFTEADGAFANTIAAFQTNGEKAFSDAANNLKMAWANIIGDTDWKEALENLSLANDALEAVYEEYNSFKTAIAEYSPEAAQMDFEIKSGTVTSLVDQITSLVDGNGNAIALENGSLLETLAQQVNDLLGEEVLTVDQDTLVEAVIKQVQAAYEAGEDPYQAVIDYLNENFPELTQGGVDYDTLTNLSIEYNTQGFSSSEKPEEFLRRRLAELNWDEGTIDMICNVLAEDGEVQDAWFGTTNGAFANAIKEKLGLADDIPIEQAVSLILEETKNGSDFDTIIQKLEENFGDSADWETVVSVTVNGLADVDQALEDLQKLTYATYAQKSAEMAMDESMKLKQQWADESKAYAESYQQYLDAIAQGEYDTAETAFQAAQTHRDALQGIEGTAQEASEEYILAMANIQAANEGTEPFSSFEELERKKPEFVASMSEVMGTINGYTDDLQEIDTQMLDTAKTILQNSQTLGGGWKQLNDEAKNQVALSLEQSATWTEVSNNLGLSTTQVGELGTLLNGYFQTFGDEIGVSSDRIQGWLEYNEQLKPAVDDLGLSWEDLSTILGVLAGNEELLNQSTQSTAEGLGQLPSVMGGVGIAAEQLASGVESSAEKTSQGARKIYTDTDDELTKTEKRLQTSTASKDAENLFSNTSEEPAKQKFKAIGDAAEETKTAIQNKKQSILNAVGEVEGGMESNINPVKDAMSKAGDEGGSKLDAGFRKYLQTVNASVHEMYSFFHDRLGDDLPTSMASWGSSAGSGFENGISTGTNRVSNVVYNVTNAILRAMSNLSTQMYNSGFYAGQGMYNGLQAWQSSLSNLAWNMANNINNAARQALKIKSPSGVLRETFGFAGEGAFLGLKDWEDAIIGEAEGISDGIAGALDADSIGYFGNSQNANITAKMDSDQQLLALLQTYLPQLANMQVVIDGDKEVGVLMPKIDKRMSAAEAMAQRGNIIYA